MIKKTFFAFSVLAIASLQAGCGETKPVLTYQTDIKPILDANCVECHVPGGKGYQKSGQRLDSYAALMEGTRFGPVVEPGSHASSTLYRLVAGETDPSIRMPHGREPLPKEAVMTIAMWVDQGANE